MIKKPITNEEARKRIANYQQVLTVCEDNLNYWRTKINKPLEFSDIFILGVDKMKTPQEFIKKTFEEQTKLLKKIDDCKRFLTEPYKSFIF